MLHQVTVPFKAGALAVQPSKLPIFLPEAKPTGLVESMSVCLFDFRAGGSYLETDVKFQI